MKDLNKLNYLTNMANTTSHYTFYLVGDGGVGKTSYLRRLTTGHYTQPNRFSNQNNNHNSDEDFVYHATFNTNYGRKNITFVEMNNCNHFDCDGVIFMFDKTEMNTLNRIGRLMENHSEYINKFVLCGNKSDLRNTSLSPACDLLNFPSIPNRQYFDISVRSLYNFEKPILSLLQQIQTNNNNNGNNLVFIPNHVNAAEFLV